mgnify:CR=1 FL=1
MNSSCPTVWQAAVQAFRFSVLLLALVGGGLLAFGADFAASTASSAVFAEHLTQFREPKGFNLVAEPPFVIESARTLMLELTP